MKTYTPTNLAERDIWPHSYLLWFGACAPTYLLAYGTALDSALDECIDWIADNAPGLLCNDQVTEIYHEQLALGFSSDDAWNEATVDTTSAGNCGDHINSWEWGIVFEDPTPKQLREFRKL